MTNRRSFLQGMASASGLSFLGGTGVLAALGAQANAAEVSGYKAIVCVFLFGGQDCHDTILPFDQASYDGYAALRPGLFADYAAQAGGSSRDRSRLLPLNPTNAAQFGGRQFALPEALAPLKGLFDSGDAAIVGNVGPLLNPMNRAQFQAGIDPRPKRLFSHNDQQSNWMSSAPEGEVFGWGGKFADTVLASGANQDEVFTAVTVSGNTVFLSGENTQQFNLNPSGPPQVDGLKNFDSSLLGTAADSPLAVSLLEQHYKNLGTQRSNLFERDVAAINKRAFESNEQFSTALENAPQLNTQFPQDGFSNRLKSIAETINIKSNLNVGRQIFFVSLGGFDTHSNQPAQITGRQARYANAIAAFHASMQEIGADNDVTLFTASEFGRSLLENGDGTDHGWGGHQFVVGGGVSGNTIYGDIPPYTLGHDQDAGNGRLIPQVSVEQYAATLGKWFGLTDAELLAALPVLANFSTKDLGFMGAPVV